MSTISFLTEDDQIVSFRPEQTLRENFQRFHAENPHVYDTLVKLARRWRRTSPSRRCGIAMLFETARWYMGVRGEGEPIALNNNYRAFYARLIMEQEADLDGIFDA